MAGRAGGHGIEVQTTRPTAQQLEFCTMPEDADQLPTSRLVRWAALGALILLAIAIYFRDGLRLPTLEAGPGAPAAQVE